MKNETVAIFKDVMTEKEQAEQTAAFEREDRYKESDKKAGFLDAIGTVVETILGFLG